MIRTLKKLSFIKILMEEHLWSKTKTLSMLNCYLAQIVGFVKDGQRPIFKSKEFHLCNILKILFIFTLTLMIGNLESWLWKKVQKTLGNAIDEFHQEIISTFTLSKVNVVSPRISQKFTIRIHCIFKSNSPFKMIILKNDNTKKSNDMND